LIFIKNNVKILIKFFIKLRTSKGNLGDEMKENKEKIHEFGENKNS